MFTGKANPGMSNLQIVIDTLRYDLLGASTIPLLLKKLSSKGINLTKRQLLVRYVKKTLHILKKERKKDNLLYIESPELPLKYDDLIYGFSQPKDMGDLYFLFFHSEKYFPSLDEFKRWYDERGYNFLFDWGNRGNFHGVKCRIISMLRECGTKVG